MPAGRPRLFKSPEDMDMLMRDYLTGDQLTMAGLCNTLGIPRQTLHEYENREEFSDIIKAARMKVEECVEKTLLYGKNQTGSIFWLKNHADYKDSKEIEHGVPDGNKLVINLNANVQRTPDAS